MKRCHPCLSHADRGRTEVDAYEEGVEKEPQQPALHCREGFPTVCEALLRSIPVLSLTVASEQQLALSEAPSQPAEQEGVA
jgi:hypothetical protein